MSLYKGNNLISGHQVLYSTTGSNTDGAMTQSATTTELNGKANTSLSNLSATGQKVIDGQWVSSQYTIANEVSVNGSTNLEYSLLNYLPNDSYNYEVFFDGYARTGNTSGNLCPLSVFTDISGGGAGLCRVITRTNLACDTSGNAILAVGISRKIYVARGTAYNGVITLRVLGYRRIGTNS